MDSRLAASISGFAATAPMTAVMTALHRALPREHADALPPRHITENAAGEAASGDTVDESGWNPASLGAHFSFGAAAGVGYIPFAGKSGLHPAAEGALYGLAVWGGAYLGAMPATGLYRSATEEPTARNLLMITAHVVWGAALGVVYNKLTHHQDQSEPAY